MLSIPSIALSGAYIAFKFFNNPSKIEIDFIAYGALFSFVISFVVLKFFITLGENFSFTPFVIYRVLLGLAILAVLHIYP